MNLILRLLAFGCIIAVIDGYPEWPQCHNCRPSVTSVSGPLAPRGKILPGQLIFEDNFNNFNLQAWRHSLTLSGKGVRFLFMILYQFTVYFMSKGL